MRLARSVAGLVVLACTARAPGETASRAAPTPPAAAADPAAAAEAEYRGHYTFGFEADRFLPCGVRGFDAGWATAGDRAAVYEAAERLRRQGEIPRDDDAARLFVRWRGVLSDSGAYGHLGAWKRQLTVTRVLEARLPTEGDCALAPPASR